MEDIYELFEWSFLKGNSDLCKILTTDTSEM